MTIPDINPEPIGGDTTLAELTTLRVGGPASEVVVARTAEDLVREAQRLWDDGEPWLLLGGGSNTVVSDEGYPGTLLLVRNTGITVVESADEPADESSDERADEPAADEPLDPGTIRIRVQAGHDWDQLVSACVEHGWAGIEALSGIPGLAGAAPVQNIGAYGAELSEVLHSIEFLEPGDDEPHRLPAADLALAYRDSTLKQGREGVVVSIDLILRTGADDDGPAAPVRYAQLATALGVEVGDRVPIREVRTAVLGLRASKGMVLDAADHDTWSAGSFFTNPIVTESFARTLPEDAPRFPQGTDNVTPAITTLEELEAGVPLRVPERNPARMVKLSAAWLIEQSGVPRGFRLPGSGAAISSKHTLAITNRGAASAADVAELARFVVQRVQQEFGVILVPEPRLYGLSL